MPSRTWAIGYLSDRTGVKIETIRYYERVGLMPQPPRSAGGHRVYDETHLKQLHFIMRGRELGFSIEQIRALLGMEEGSLTCGEIQQITLDHLQNVEGKIRDLQRLARTLRLIADKCAQNITPDCPVIDTLYS